MRRVEHAEVTSTFEQRIRCLSFHHPRQSRLVGDEVNLTLLVRARHAQRAQLCGGSKEDAADEHPPSRYALRRGRRIIACRFSDESDRLPGCGHGIDGNSHGASQGGVANRRGRIRKLGPRVSSEAGEREPSRNKNPPIHLTATFALARWAPQPSACASGAILSGIECAPFLSSRLRQTR